MAYSSVDKLVTRKWIAQNSLLTVILICVFSNLLQSTQKEDIKDFAKVMRNKVSKKKKKSPEHPSKGRFIPIEMEEAVPSEGEDE